ncbi:GntR family transcriptional regulator [bacterium]|nr:MAG: GntR family transcriptional regulator [bacterium]
MPHETVPLVENLAYHALNDEAYGNYFALRKPAQGENGVSVSPLTHVVARAIRRHIADGTLPCGSPLPSERSLATQHGVSRTVVRDAVALLAREGLLIQSERCRPVVGAVPRPKRHNGTLRIGVWLWPHADDYFASSVFRGIQRAAHGTDLRLIVGTATHRSWDDDLDSEARFINQLVETEHADGLIIWYLGGSRNLRVLQEARKKGLECVFIDRLPPDEFPSDFVGTENVGAARAAVAYLIELGHRRVAFVGNLDTASTVKDRCEGYVRALADAGIPVDPKLQLVFDPREGESEGAAIRRVAEAVLALSPRPTAVFAVNDSVALALLESFRDLGVNVPDDLSIVGFDGLLHWVPGGGPLSTVKQNFPAIGEYAGAALLSRIAKGSPSSYRHVLLDAPLSLGGSTGLCPTGPDLGNEAEIAWINP